MKTFYMVKYLKYFCKCPTFYKLINYEFHIGRQNEDKAYMLQILLLSCKHLSRNLISFVLENKNNSKISLKNAHGKFIRHFCTS